MAYTANKLKAAAVRRLVDFDPDATTATIVTLNPAASENALSLADYQFANILVGVFKSVGSGDIDLAEIVTCDAADGTGNVTTIASRAVADVEADAVGDTIWLEVTGEQIAAGRAASNKYVGVRLTLATATDECVVYFEGHGRKADGLTADYIQ